MEKVVTRITLIFSLVFGSFSSVWSQEIVPPLERKVSLEFNGARVKEVLKKIEQQADLSFAYKTGILDENILLNRAYVNKSVREVLNDVFQGSISYKAKGNYILLQSNVKSEGTEVIIEGYVVDLITDLKIPYATIYDVATLSSAVSDEYGHYILKLDVNKTSNLKVKKQNYHDADILYRMEGSNVINIMMQPFDLQKDSVQIVFSDTSSLLKRIQTLRWLKLSDERKANIGNFKDLIQSKVQFSVLPNIGTNGKLSSSTTVDYSFNLLGGFVGGVRKLELGGIFNMDLDSVQYAQAAGVFNVVGGPQSGFQGSGVFNLNLSSFQGAQFGGTSNFVRGDFNGFQGAGFSNVILGKARGTQFAGFTNFAKDSSLLSQFAGFYNHAGKNNKGAQVAGFMNYTGRNFSGAQVAGFMNFSRDHLAGTQIAGFLNVAKNVNGSQIGFLNVNDSIHGIPVGFLSFSRKGLHQLEISTNEAIPLQLAFKTGVHSFYNSLLVSARIENNHKPIFGLGYGIGTSLRFNDKNRLFFDLQGQQFVQSNLFEPNTLSKLTVSYQYQFKKNLALAIGPSLNFLYLNDTNLSSTNDLKRLAPNDIYNFSSSNGRYGQMWVGGHLALRIF